MKRIKISRKNIYFIVDDEIFDKVNKYKWRLSITGYVSRNQVRGRERPSQRTIYLHHEIIGKKEGLEVDHINRNKLDNRKQNLRFLTHLQNSHNRGLNKNNKSGINGVYYNKDYEKWMGAVRYNYRRHYTKGFSTKEEAKRAYIVLVEKLNLYNLKFRLEEETYAKSLSNE